MNIEQAEKLKKGDTLIYTGDDSKYNPYVKGNTYPVASDYYEDEYDGDYVIDLLGDDKCVRCVNMGDCHSDFDLI